VKLHTIRSEGLAHNSYFLSDGEEAAVVDPRRDCEVYLSLAEKECAKIKYVFETHRNEDYVVGSLELQRLTGAEICHSKQLNFKYGEHNLDDGETFNVGGLKVNALYTPGHTNESLCYAVTEGESSGALMVFTGDTLFVGSVGRTDLQGTENRAKQAEKLYDSIHEKLLPLGDHVLVYPAHGSGSVCGNEISERNFSTLGYERKTNPFLKLDKVGFVERAGGQLFVGPPYFRKMEEYNLNGAPKRQGLPAPKALDAAKFEDEMAEVGTVVVDTRLPYAFAGSHIPGALSLWLQGTAAYAGWILGFDERVLLVVERRKDVELALRFLWRLGLDNTYGYLCVGMGGWQEQGKPLSHLGTVSAAELHERRERFVVLDVREPNEWKTEGVINGSEQVFFGDIATKSEGMNRNMRYAVMCSVGNRGSVAASVLKKKGFVEVYNVLGGMTAWKNLGYPVVNV
jgi:hydroxyacylglutathione hydrolase